MSIGRTDTSHSNVRACIGNDRGSAHVVRYRGPQTWPSIISVPRSSRDAIRRRPLPRQHTAPASFCTTNEQIEHTTTPRSPASCPAPSSHRRGRPNGSTTGRGSGTRSSRPRRGSTRKRRGRCAFALPVELSTEQQRTLVIDFVKEQFVARGMVADVCIHEASEQNPHAHILLTTRTISKKASARRKRGHGTPRRCTSGGEPNGRTT